MTSTQKKSSRPFLTAQWRHLAILNFPIDPDVLQADVPAGTELDYFAGKTYVSIVGFMFLDARVYGFPIPLHCRFEEVNLRFYVRRHCGNELRRGVVFIKEISPRLVIEKAAKLFYDENYMTLPMQHEIHQANGNGSANVSVVYRWRDEGRWYAVQVHAETDAQLPEAGSREEFIAEHYWGYSARGDNSTLEYRVEHPPWKIQQGIEAQYDCNVSRIYGSRFAEALSQAPEFSFLMEGSAVKVFRPEKIATQNSD